MNRRVYIAVVDAQKTNHFRLIDASYYNNLINDWPNVQKIASDYCSEHCRHSYATDETVAAIEAKIKDQCLSYDRRKLVEFIDATVNGPAWAHIHPCFTDFSLLINHEMDVIENYFVGCTDNIAENIGTPFYTNCTTQDLFQQSNPRVVSKADFEQLIESWRKIIVNHYKEILFDPTKESRWRCHIESKMDQWECPGSEPYNLDSQNHEIVKAFDTEYRIFELMRLYKSIDWTRHTVIVFGK